MKGAVALTSDHAYPAAVQTAVHAQSLIHGLKLREAAGADVQTYALGLKEVWQIDPERHKEGLAEHTVGYPLDQWTYGGGFIYHMSDSRIALGLNVGLDYANPYLDPHEEFQRWKKHPYVSKLLEGGTCLEFGASSLTQGAPRLLTKKEASSAAACGRSRWHETRCDTSCTSLVLVAKWGDSLNNGTPGPSACATTCLCACSRLVCSPHSAPARAPDSHLLSKCSKCSQTIAATPMCWN
jgi:hypothetical protein